MSRVAVTRARAEGRRNYLAANFPRRENKTRQLRRVNVSYHSMLAETTLKPPPEWTAAEIRLRYHIRNELKNSIEELAPLTV